MAAIALLDLMRKNPNFGSQAFNSRGLFSSNFAGGSLAASFVVSTPFAFRSIFGESQVAYCDAGAIPLDGDYMSNIRSASGKIIGSDALKHSTKHYDIQLKPLLSAFHWRSLAVVSVRSFLLYYLPLLEAQSRNDEDDDEDEEVENPEENRVDMGDPFKKSVKKIFYETSVATTRRVFERLAVHYVSQRMAWKLLKDLPKSASRKAARGMLTPKFIFRVSRTTCRGHLLGVLASWIVQVGVDVYRFFTSNTRNDNENDNENENGIVGRRERLVILGKKISGRTAMCGASLVLASIGAGIGAALVRPSVGQWIGCLIGDAAGPFLVALCFDGLFSDI